MRSPPFVAHLRLRPEASQRREHAERECSRAESDNRRKGGFLVIPGNANGGRQLLNLPKTMRQQIGEPHEPLPTCGCPCQPMIEASIKDERFPCRIAESPKISDGIALNKWRRE